MDTGKALLRAILLNPADDAARLVYADWLEENGQGERAEFVRLQIAAHSRGESIGSLALWNLLDSAEHWFPEVCKACRIDWDDWGVMHDETVHWEYKHHTNEFFARRGFVCAIRLSLAAFMEHAKALFSAHPFTAVTLTDRKPATDGMFTKSRHGWFSTLRALCGASDLLPHELHKRLSCGERAGNWTLYDKPGDALTDLSQACVAYGRSLAGLPPLQQG